MHILFLTDNFPPEGNAPATRTYEHAVEWVKMGHEVTVITCAPNFPEGKVYAGYKNSFYSRSKMDGINVVRVKSFIASNEGFLLRIIDFISFMFSSFFAGLFQRHVDVIVATSPQFFTAVSGWALSAIKRKKFIFELRDIWPASIKAVGAMEDSMIIRLLEKLEIFLYKRADVIVSVTHAFKRELISRGINEDKISVILNGVDLNKYTPLTYKDKIFATQYDLNNKIVIGYIGTHGLAHGLEHIITVAEKLKQDPKLVFLFVGTGAVKQNLMMLVKQKGLTNVIFMPRQDKKDMPRVWSLCDISLISLKNTELFKTVIPSKIFESMGMGLPILASIPNGEASDIILNNHAGWVVAPENPVLLAEKITAIIKSNTMINQVGKASELASKIYDRKELAIQMEKLF